MQVPASSLHLHLSHPLCYHTHTLHEKANLIRSSPRLHQGTFLCSFTACTSLVKAEPKKNRRMYVGKTQCTKNLDASTHLVTSRHLLQCFCMCLLKQRGRTHELTGKNVANSSCIGPYTQFRKLKLNNGELLMYWFHFRNKKQVFGIP